MVAYNNNDIMKMRINKPIIKRQIRDVKFIRNGRGFSKSELKRSRDSKYKDGKEQWHINSFTEKNKKPREHRTIKAYCKRYIKFEKNSRKKKG